MTNEWDGYASEWDVDESAQHYAGLAYQELLKVVSPTGLRVFDFGCGTGLLSEKLAQETKEIVALDGSSKMIEVLEQKKLANLVTIADFLSDDLMKNNQHLAHPFDLVVASSVCSFLPDFEETLNYISDLLKPNAMFIQWDWLAVDEEGDFGLTEETVRRAHERAGFVKTRISIPFVMKSHNNEMPVLMACSMKAEA